MSQDLLTFFIYLTFASTTFLRPVMAHLIYLCVGIAVKMSFLSTSQQIIILGMVSIYSAAIVLNHYSRQKVIIQLAIERQSC